MPAQDGQWCYVLTEDVEYEGSAFVDAFTSRWAAEKEAERLNKMKPTHDTTYNVTALRMRAVPKAVKS